MSFGLRSRMSMAVAAGAVALGLLVSGCTTSHATRTAGAKIKGGTAVWALPPATAPNYAFPFMSGAYISVYNLNTFSNLMYRPLYWFGDGSHPRLNNSLSLAETPRWSGKTATITLKPYRGPSGTPETATDVMFWVNMLKAVGATDWGAYNGFPAAFVSSIKVVSPTELQMTTNRAYSHTWFLYNNLSQITPMPAAWDRTASGPSACATKITDCAGVYRYLDARSRQLTT